MLLGLVLWAAGSAAPGPSFPAPDGTDPAPTPERIAYAIGAVTQGVDGIGLGTTVQSAGALETFYRNRAYRPAWFRSGFPGRQAWQVFAAARSAREEGLNPARYHAERLDSLLRVFQRKLFLLLPPPPGSGLRLELLLTDAYLTLGDDLLSGCVRPAPLADPRPIRTGGLDLPVYLEQALASGADLRASLRALLPSDPGYGWLKEWLARYRKIEASGGWARLSAGPGLALGDSGTRVSALCRRLRAEGHLRAKACSDSFTVAMEAAVRDFQARHGLATTGSIGPAEYARLDGDVGHRIMQIRIGLEIWRWLPRDPGPKRVEVNIADYRLEAYAAGRDTLRMKVVVGRKGDPTPLLADRMVGLALNPPWNVPDAIVREEIVPELRKDPDYLAKHDMELLRDTGQGPVPIEPKDIDWRAIDAGDFPYRVRQRPGGASALGKFKFVLTNPFNIYLHDTPSAAYFRREERAFSHGCVRVENPMELALWALRPDPSWNRESLRMEIGTGRQTFLPLPGGGIPVYILYRTAFTDAAGGLRLRRDIYGWDAKLRKALDRAP